MTDEEFARLGVLLDRVHLTQHIHERIITMTAVVGMVPSLLAEVRRLKGKVGVLRSALHLAYDWMGRNPKSNYEDSHYVSDVAQVRQALGTYPDPGAEKGKKP